MTGKSPSRYDVNIESYHASASVGCEADVGVLRELVDSRGILGWVERSDTHHVRLRLRDGFRCAQPILRVYFRAPVGRHRDPVAFQRIKDAAIGSNRAFAQYMRDD
jgi:hypothetical protein